MATVQATKAGTSITSTATNVGADTVVGAPYVEGTNSSLISSATTSHACNLPSGIQAGEDLLLIFGCGESAVNKTSLQGTTITAPAGWNLLIDTREDGMNVGTDS